MSSELEALNRLEQKIENGFKRLEEKIDNIDKEHTLTRERQIRVEQDVLHYKRSIDDLASKHEIDKRHMYENMDDKIKRSVRESVLSTKLWVYGGVITIIVMFAGWIGKKG